MTKFGPVTQVLLESRTERWWEPVKLRVKRPWLRWAEPMLQRLISWIGVEREMVATRTVAVPRTIEGLADLSEASEAMARAWRGREPPAIMLGSASYRELARDLAQNCLYTTAQYARGNGRHAEFMGVPVIINPHCDGMVVLPPDFLDALDSARAEAGGGRAMRRHDYPDEIWPIQPPA